MLIVNPHNGDELREFVPVDKPQLLPDFPTLTRIDFSCMVARHQGKVLFVYNSWIFRQAWELPAGGIDAGETPEAAAIRELYEESGQVVNRAACKAMIVMFPKYHRRLELGTMYVCDLETVQPFTRNHEADAMVLWDLNTPVEGNVDHMSEWLARKLVTA